MVQVLLNFVPHNFKLKTDTKISSIFRYDSRDIFPCGWCSKSGHPLQPPGQKSTGQNRFKSRTSNVLPITTVSSVPEVSEPDTSSTTTNNNKPEVSMVGDIKLYVNPNCYCGPFLDAVKFTDNWKQRRFHSDPATVLKEIFQRFLQRTKHPRQLFGMIRQGAGDTITLSVEEKNGKTSKLQLPVFEEEADVYEYVKEQLKELCACENLVSKKMVEVCKKCKKLQAETLAYELELTNGNSETETPKETTEPVESSKPVEKVPEPIVVVPNNVEPVILEPVVVQIKKSMPDIEAATSTTQNENLLQRVQTVEPAEWTIEDVIQYIAMTDPNLEHHADLFRKHEIDGKALLLLNSDMMMKYMGLKLGPALKICNLVNRIKGRRHLNIS